MGDLTMNAIELMRAQEQIRQERLSFDHTAMELRHADSIRTAFGWVLVFLLPAIAIFSMYVTVVGPPRFPSAVVTAASGALFVDTIGLVVFGVRKLLETVRSVQLQPVTTNAIPSETSQAPTD